MNRLTTNIEKCLDLLFYHCYYWARRNDESAKASMACYAMFFVLLNTFISLSSLASLIMPHKILGAFIILSIVSLMLIFCALEDRYKNMNLCKKIVTSHICTPRLLESVLLYLVYNLIASFPTLLLIKLGYIT